MNDENPSLATGPDTTAARQDVSPADAEIDRGRAVDRVKAAMVLRAAKRANDEMRCELTEAAIGMLPDSRAALRLRVRSLLEDGNFEHAHALIARGLLLSPNNVPLMEYRARALDGLHRHDEALDEISHLLRLQPQRVGALTLGGRIAMKAELHERAVMWLTRAHLRAPLCERIKRLLAEALVRSDQPETALEVMSLIPLPFPLLRARSLRMLGRLRDAADVLDTAIASSARSAEAVGIDERDADKGVLSADDSFDALLTESLIVSELRGDSGDICRFSKLITDSTPGAMLQAAKHELARGAFRHAIRRAVSLRGDQIHGAASLAIITAAAGMMQRNRLATRALRKLRKRFGSSNLPVMHECWRRAMLGEIIRDQRNPRRACADPASSVLRPLLKQTVRTLERRLHRHTAADATHDVEMIQQHYALCRDALKLRSKATA